MKNKLMHATQKLGANDKDTVHSQLLTSRERETNEVTEL